MPTDKEIKKEFKLKASKDPDKYYATSVLKEEGFSRKQCKKCGTFFWSTQADDFCGDPACSGGFRFINDTPAHVLLQTRIIGTKLIFEIYGSSDDREVTIDGPHQ